jgi:pantoate--beta-alanine ligase
LLSPRERTRALILSRTLAAADSIARAGESDAQTLVNAALAIFNADSGPDSEDVPVRLDYAAIVDPDTLLPIANTAQGALIAVAAYIGQTRLIDNLLLPPLN